MTTIEDARKLAAELTATPQTLAQLRLEKLPEGDYALRRKDTGRVHFFTVQYGREGSKWQGYTFVEEHIGPNRRKVRDAKERLGIIKAIERDPLGSLKLYGSEKGICGYCHLELTHPRSLFWGRGEKCSKDRGLPW